MNLEGGVGDGVRTRDIRCHRPTLYQLSYAHHRSDYRQFTLNLGGIEGHRTVDRVVECSGTRIKATLKKVHFAIDREIAMPLSRFLKVFIAQLHQN